MTILDRRDLDREMAEWQPPATELDEPFRPWLWFAAVWITVLMLLALVGFVGAGA